MGWWTRRCYDPLAAGLPPIVRCFRDDLLTFQLQQLEQQGGENACLNSERGLILLVPGVTICETNDVYVSLRSAVIETKGCEYDNAMNPWLVWLRLDVW